MDSWENFLKPLLMPILAVYYVISIKEIRSFDYKIILALIFSTAGDVFLMPYFNLFIAGLVGFLIAHVFYISAFLSEKKRLKKDGFRNQIIFLTSLAIYSLLLYSLNQKIDAPGLLIAITLYATILLVLLISSIIRKPNNNSSSQFVVWGAFLFMLSDSMIAINKFVIEIPLEALLIMGTYTVAQALLVEGSLIRNR
jgi:uncharacterized membrane protein YhhN